MIDQPTFDWDSLVDRAESAGPGELLHCLKVYSAWFHAYRGGFELADWPAVVLNYVNSQLRPTGKRGRPQTTEWALAVIHDVYKTQRLLFETAKKTGGKEADASGREWPINERPSELAVSTVAAMMNRSEGAALDAIFPARKIKQRQKKAPK